jgi:hypothetical protein
MILRLVLLAAVVCGSIGLEAQLPPPVDASKVGPQVGSAVPPINGTDQFGRVHTLASVSGPKGAMLVFFRSADW